MAEIITLLSEHVGLFIVSLIAIGGMGGYMIDSFLKHHHRRLKHRERMAELHTQAEIAKALHAAPEEAQRSELAQQLLAAYDEAGAELQNDEKGSLVRWELSKDK